MPELPASPALRLAGWAAFGVPLAVAAGRITGIAAWADDVTVVRALGMLQVGAEGLVSSALASGWVVLPLGNRLFRLGLFAALLVGLGGLLTFQLCVSMLGRRVRPLPAAAIGLCAAWGATLGPAWQSLALGVGRGALAEVLLVLLLLCAAIRQTSRRSLAQAIVLGLLAAEQRGLLPAGAVIVVLSNVSRRQAPTSADVGIGLIALLATVGIVLAPSGMELFGNSSGPQLGLDFDVPVGNEVATVGFGEAVNGYIALMAVLGALRLASMRRLWLLAGPLAVCCAALLARKHGVAAAFSAAYALAGFGVSEAVAWIWQARVTFRPAAVSLAALFHLAVTLLSVEDGRRAAERASISGARAWTREALDRLPPRSLVLVQNADAAWRLWAAQANEGVRPDVVVVPAPLLTHGSLAKRLIDVEPRLTRVVRDLTAGSVASEYALSELADSRPVRVELDPAWPVPVLSHLVSEGLWFRLAPEALGRSDRRLGMGALNGAVDRVLDASWTRAGRDEVTLRRLEDDLVAHAAVGAALGEKTSAGLVLEDLRRIAPNDARVERISTALTQGRHSVDLRNLALRR